MLIGATEDAVRSADARSRRRRRWTCSRSPASAASASRRSGRRARRSVSADDAHGARRTSRRAARLDGIDRRDERHEPGSQTTPLTDAGPGRLRGVRGLDRQAVPALRDPDRRQRAEPQPLLAAAVRRRRQRRGRARLRERCSPDLRRAQGGVARASNVLGGAVSPARRRRRRRHPRRRTRRRPSSTTSARVPRERAHDADHGRLRVPPVRGQLERRTVERAASELDRRSRSPTTPSSSRSLGEAFDGTAQPGSTLPIFYDEFGVETQIPSTEQAPVHRHRAGDDEAGDEATQAAYYRRGDRSSPSASRTCAGSSSSTPSTRRTLAGWQSGVYYADGTPKSSLGAVTAALDESRRGVVAQCPGLQLAVHRDGRAARLARSTLTLRPRLLVRRAALPPPGQAARRRGHGPAIGGQPTTLPLRAPKATRAVPASAVAAIAVAERGTRRRSLRVRRAPRLAIRGVEGQYVAYTLLPRRPGVAAAAGRGARRRARTRSPRSSRTSPTASTTCARTRRRASGRTPTSSSGRSPSATRTSASSAPR